MSDPTRAILLSVFILAASVWVGGYVAIGVVARVATRTLSAEQRVEFFRGLGRSYGFVGVTALIAAIGTGAALLSDHTWDGTLATATALTATLVVALGIGILQARRMTRIRADALATPEDHELTRRVRQGARAAALLRAAIGLLSLALIALGPLLAT